MKKWVFLLGGLLLVILGFRNLTAGDGTVVDQTAFEEQAEISEETAFIGTNVTLHQEIHKEDGTVMYRYKLATDCPFWEYEDRYESNTPLEWVTGDASAVETEATAVTIRFEDVSYATGQYFSVPLLGLSQNDQTLEEYEESLMASAYAAYYSASGDDENPIPGILLVGFGVLFLLLFFVVACAAIASGKPIPAPSEKEKESMDWAMILITLKRKGLRNTNVVYMVPAEDYQNVVDYLDTVGTNFEDSMPFEMKLQEMKIRYRFIGSFNLTEEEQLNTQIDTHRLYWHDADMPGTASETEDSTVVY